MKIDKIVFSCSEEFSPFWNVQAPLWASMGIKPVCLLFGKKANTTMSEAHGEVIELEYDQSLPWVVQLTWAKFAHPTSEPETTWMIGDIDLVPLQKFYFTRNLEHVDPGHYVHLNAGAIGAQRLGRLDGFEACGSQRVCMDRRSGPGADVPGHYHVAKGKLFEIMTHGAPFIDQVRLIVESGRYGLGPYGCDWIQQDRDKGFHAREWYWCAEEAYSSEQLFLAIEQGKVKYAPCRYDNGNGGQRIDRSGWNGTDYHGFSMEAVSAGRYVDIHCARPYAAQEAALARILDASEFYNA